VALVPWRSPASEVSLGFPEGVLGGQDVSAWERIEGHAEIGSQSIDYTFWVDPRYGALYAVTRYKISVVEKGPDGREVRRPAGETLIWNSQPGSREPLQCYALAPAGETPGGWRRVAARSVEYGDAMKTAISLYKYHSTQLRNAVR